MVGGFHSSSLKDTTLVGEGILVIKYGRYSKFVIGVPFAKIDVRRYSSNPKIRDPPRVAPQGQAFPVEQKDCW